MQRFYYSPRFLVATQPGRFIAIAIAACVGMLCLSIWLQAGVFIAYFSLAIVVLLAVTIALLKTPSLIVDKTAVTVPQRFRFAAKALPQWSFPLSLIRDVRVGRTGEIILVPDNADRLIESAGSPVRRGIMQAMINTSGGFVVPLRDSCTAGTEALSETLRNYVRETR